MEATDRRLYNNPNSPSFYQSQWKTNRMEWELFTMPKVKTNIQKRLDDALPLLSSKQQELLADFADYLKSREEWEATMELLSDSKMKREIEEGMEQVRRGETHSWRHIRKNV
ncbi:MAG: hypothetical protein AB1656_06930 [Candidatus Omnitrophota bacterium]